MALLVVIEAGTHTTTAAHPGGCAAVVVRSLLGDEAETEGQWWAGASSARAREASISRSASVRPTHSAPSTDLPGSRSL